MSTYLRTVSNNLRSGAITELFKPSWYKHQLKGWSVSSYLLVMFGIGGTIGFTFGGGTINFMAFITMLASIFGITTVVSITNAKPLNGVFGLISALLLIWVGVSAGNYNEALMQGFYIVLLDLPVLLNPKWADNVGGKIRVLVDKNGSTKANLARVFLTALFFVVGFGLLYYIDSSVLVSSRPFWDSLGASFGITGAILTTLRFKETYYFWVLQGIASIILWGITAQAGAVNFALMFTYIVYFMNDGLGLFSKYSPWNNFK